MLCTREGLASSSPPSSCSPAPLLSRPQREEPGLEQCYTGTGSLYIQWRSSFSLPFWNDQVVRAVSAVSPSGSLADQFNGFTTKYAGEDNCQRGGKRDKRGGRQTGIVQRNCPPWTATGLSLWGYFGVGGIFEQQMSCPGVGSK